MKQERETKRKIIKTTITRCVQPIKQKSGHKKLHRMRGKKQTDEIKKRKVLFFTAATDASC